MAADQVFSKPVFFQAIDDAWTQLRTYLAGLAESQMEDRKDAEGWNIKDHLTHLAAWEQAVLFLFEGKPRYQTLGIEQQKLASRAYNEINAAIRDRWQAKSVRAVLDELAEIHQALMTRVAGLSEADLQRPVKEFFPHDEPAPIRRVADLIHANTAKHFNEHLDYIKLMAG